MAELIKPLKYMPVTSGGPAPEGVPDIISLVRFEGVARNTQFVKVAIVIPAPISQLIYGELVCEVKCFSRVKIGYHYRGIFPLHGMNQEQATQRAGVLAGAMAENLVDVYKDRISPREYAIEGGHAFIDALTRFEARQHAPLPRDKTLEYILDAMKRLGALA